MKRLARTLAPPMDAFRVFRGSKEIQNHPHKCLRRIGMNPMTCFWNGLDFRGRKQPPDVRFVRLRDVFRLAAADKKRWTVERLFSCDQYFAKVQVIVRDAAQIHFPDEISVVVATKVLQEKPAQAQRR